MTMLQSDAASQATASTCPPPPSSAPETFRIEDVVVTRSPETLTVLNPRVKKGMFWSIGLVLVMVALSWLFIGWESYSPYSQPVHHSSSNQVAFAQRHTFQKDAKSIGVLFGIMCLSITGVFWSLFTWRLGGGVTTFSREARQFRRGTRWLGTTGKVESLALRTTKTPFGGNFGLRYTAHIKNGRTWFRQMCWLASFHQPDNARRLAEVVAEFLQVPVQDSSRRGRGEENHATA